MNEKKGIDAQTNTNPNPNTNTNKINRIKGKTDKDTHFDKIKNIPNELSTLRMNILNYPNQNQNSNRNKTNANHHQSSTHRNPLNHHQDNLSNKWENNQTPNQQLLETFYHPNNKADQYNFGIVIHFKSNRREKNKNLISPHTQSNNSMTYANDNLINNTTQYMQNELKSLFKHTKQFSHSTVKIPQLKINAMKIDSISISFPNSILYTKQ